MTDNPSNGPPGRTRKLLPSLVLAAAIGAAAAGLVAFILRPAPPPDVEPRREAPAVAPAPPQTAAPPQADVSRSRGRTDWIFFFKPGDQLARMSDEAPLGLVIRLEKTHTFPDGTTGPAYLLQVPEGGQRFVDADEVERGARLQ
ncbi:MAG TPA: hypothetical protein VFV05_01320 [Methylomirabilota bacterium]|nr:hypothetical protein [Methylomirabilota bacterium]